MKAITVTVVLCVQSVGKNAKMVSLFFYDLINIIVFFFAVYDLFNFSDWFFVFVESTVHQMPEISHFVFIWFYQYPQQNQSILLNNRFICETVDFFNNGNRIQLILIDRHFGLYFFNHFVQLFLQTNDRYWTHVSPFRSVFCVILL